MGCEAIDAAELNGSVIKIKGRWGYYHYGIYVKEPFSPERAIHYTDEGSDFKGVVHEPPIEDFLQGENSFSVCKFSSSFSGKETVRRARSAASGTGETLSILPADVTLTFCTFLNCVRTNGEMSVRAAARSACLGRWILRYRLERLRR